MSIMICCRCCIFMEVSINRLLSELVEVIIAQEATGDLQLIMMCYKRNVCSAKILNCFVMPLTQP